MKKMILTTERHEKHLLAGQNKQQTVPEGRAGSNIIQIASFFWFPEETKKNYLLNDISEGKG